MVKRVKLRKGDGQLYGLSSGQLSLGTGLR
jgi:hypothetical protein